MSEKYVNRELDGVGHCPFCRGVIIKNFKASDGGCLAEFSMRCPHCQKNMRISVENGKIIIRDEN